MTAFETRARGGRSSYLSALSALFLILGGASQFHVGAGDDVDTGSSNPPDQEFLAHVHEEGGNITELPKYIRFETELALRVAVALGEHPSDRELAKRVEAALLDIFPLKVFDKFLNLYLMDAYAMPSAAVLLHGTRIPPECTHSPETLSAVCLDAGGALMGNAVVAGLEKLYILMWTQSKDVKFNAYVWIQESIVACMASSQLARILENRWPALDVSLERRFAKAVAGCVLNHLARNYFPPRVVAVLPGEKRGYALQGLVYTEYLEPRLYSILPRKFTPGGLIAVMP